MGACSKLAVAVLSLGSGEGKENFVIKKSKKSTTEFSLQKSYQLRFIFGSVLFCKEGETGSKH